MYLFAENYYRRGKKNYALLRGNPGLGKTSFIIYLLYQLKQYNEELKRENKEILNILVYKNVQKEQNVEYKLNDEGILEISTKQCDANVIISDSYNCPIPNYDSLSLILYVSSPDTKNYKEYSNKQGENNSDCIDLYLDVFNETEIKEWKEFCLPKDLKDHIENNKSEKKYGYIPRHIYFDAIYHVYYGKVYWEDIYGYGINAVIGNLGFIDFLRNYLLPCRTDTEKITDTKVFDTSICHYIIKYKYEDMFTVSTRELEFISNEVIDYVFKSINHISKKSDMEAIMKLFYGYLNKQYRHPIYIQLFQELVWCKCVYYTYHLINVIGEENFIKIDNDEDLIHFNSIFNLGIYKISKDGCYIVHFLTLENGEMIYVVNNCFIHVHKDKRNCYERNKGISIFKKDCNKAIMIKYIYDLNEYLGWNVFNYICVYSENAKDPDENFLEFLGLGMLENENITIN